MQSLRDLKKRLDDWLDKPLDGFFVGASVAVAAAIVVGSLLLAERASEIAEEVGDVVSSDSTQEQKRSGESHSAEAAADSTSGAQPVSAWPIDSTYAVAADEGHAVYFGNGASLDIADLSDPQRPTRKGRVALPATPRDIALSGGVAYVALSDSPAGGEDRGTGGVFGVRAVDVSDPSAPQVVGAFDADGPIEEIAVSGSHAYVIGEESGLRVLDVSDPRRMRQVGTYVPDGPESEANGVAAARGGGPVYLAAGESGLQVLDVSDPGRPQLRSAVHVGGVATGVAVSDGHAYLLWRAQSMMGEQGRPNDDWFEQGLRVLDLSRPARPQSVGAFEIGKPTMAVWAAGDRAYAAVLFDGVRVVDVSEASRPRKVGVLWPAPRDLAAAKGRVYLATRTGGLQVAKRSERVRSQ